MMGLWASPVVLVVKNPPANASDAGDGGSIPELRKSPGGGYGNKLQYYGLENPMDRGAWRATVHRVAESDTTEHTQWKDYLPVKLEGVADE